MSDRIDKPLSAEEASAFLGGAVSPERLVEAAQRKEVDHVKLPVDGAYLFWAADLIAWCKQHHRRVTQPQSPRLRRGA